MGAFDNLEITLTISKSELNEYDTVACKINTLTKDAQFEQKAIDRMKELILEDINHEMAEGEAIVRAYNEKLFKGKQLGYICKVTIPQLTIRTKLNNEYLDCNDLCRKIMNDTQLLDKICKYVIKACYNIEYFETIKSDLGEEPTFDTLLDRPARRAEFKSDNKKIGLTWDENRLSLEGYTMVFSVVIE